MTLPLIEVGSPTPPDGFRWQPNCRHFVGGLPCRHQRPCAGCPHYDPVGRRVLIVMLGLLGDMLIASALPARIKREHPDTHITWLVDDACAPVLRMNPHVDRVLPYNWESTTQLLSETFTAVFSFERTPAAASIVDRVSAEHKAGLAWGGPHNGLYPIGQAAEHFFAMNTDNVFRTRFNTTTWTELYFAVAGYRYDQEPYALEIPATARDRVAGLLPATTRPRVCLNVGGSLPTKIWPAEHWRALGIRLLQDGYELVITGGPTDEPMCRTLREALGRDDYTGTRVRYAPLAIEEFAAVPQHCQLMVTGDSFGFHLALAHQTPCVLLLGPSNGAEVIPKHATTVTALRSRWPCSPCAHQVTCGGVGGCMTTIDPHPVHMAAFRLLNADRLPDPAERAS